MYVAAKGGEAAIRAAHALLDAVRRGDPAIPEIGLDQIAGQLALAVDRVMAEGSLYDRELAALALKQARGDLIEAAFLARALRATLPRFGASAPVDTGAMRVERRVSATFKDVPGGQVLGPTFDYTHRLLDARLATQARWPTSPIPDDAPPPPVWGRDGVGGGAAAGPLPAPTAEVVTPPTLPSPTRGEGGVGVAPMPRVTDLIGAEGLIEASPADDGAPPGDLTRAPLAFPADRALRLQALARGDEGFLLSLAYSTQRGYGRTHPFVGEIRFGAVEVSMFAEELGFEVPLGDIALTECQSVNQFTGSAEAPPQFTRGYGLAFGQSERKAIAMALMDRALRAGELGEERTAPAQDAEFVLSHADNVQATGFLEHLKLPHYVDFQAELELVRRLRADRAAPPPATAPAAEDEA
ncbi:carbon-phosphorus lyase complex subunit PhnI [Xanthobacter sp. KR7-225]|uniref:carbon-phosphorus lyase complex subunit PhnI n=1 Tax=Xanthobacter sp. KR7-225 TaxID=3156613 RepID=UPI0032B4C15D